MNILDCNLYRINVEPIRLLLKDLPDEQKVPFISNLALITMVPIIIVCYYVIELYGELPGLISLIEDLKRFYHVDEVINHTTKKHP